MSLIWVIAFLGLLLVEFLTVGLVSIWFAVGALGALITSFITESSICNCFSYNSYCYKTINEEVQGN